MANQQNRGQDQQSQGTQNMQGQQSQGEQGSQSTYWRQQFQSEPYYQQGQKFENYEQAYRTGEQGRAQYGSQNQDFQVNEQNLRSDYENNTRGQQDAVKWDQGGQQACRAAWDRAGSSSKSSDRDVQASSSQSQGKQRGS